MNQEDAIALVQQYYQAFNQADMGAFLALLTDDVAHDVNQGGREIGKEAFSKFMDKMNQNYREQLTDIHVMASACGTRAAAEFEVHGEYLHTDDGLPEAKGQRYILPAGAFFELQDGKISRISNYYNLEDWLSQVSA